MTTTYVMGRPVSSNGHDGPSRGDFSELGHTGRSQYSTVLFDDYNPDMTGPKAIQTFDKMRKGDATVRTSLRIIKAPLMAAQWYVQPASNSEEHKLHAQFIDYNLHSMSKTFEQVLWEALLSLDFGYYVFEKVFEPRMWRPEYDRARERLVFCWKKLGPRHPKTTIRWEFDNHGGVSRLVHNKNPDGYEEQPIDIDKLLIFTIDEEAGNPEGISLLRSAYKHWYYKENLYKVDAIQKERHGIGIPDGELPPNFTQQDKKLMNEMLSNLRTNEKAFVTRPPGFKVGFLELQGQPVDVLASAQHHDVEILKNVMAQFLNLGTEESGSRAVGQGQMEMFVKSIRYVADIIRGVFNKWAIPQLIDYNFETDVYPELRVRRIGENADWRALSVAVRNFVETGVFTPTPELEGWMADYMDFPMPSDEAMARGVEERTAKKPGDYSNRVPLPTDGG